jgi:hypothetical protein
MAILIAKKVKSDILEIEMLKHWINSAVTENCCFYTKTCLLANEVETYVVIVDLLLLYSI